MARIGRDRIVDRIARGGMGEVYHAVAEGIGGFEKAVALKLSLAYRASKAPTVGGSAKHVPSKSGTDANVGVRPAPCAGLPIGTR